MSTAIKRILAPITSARAQGVRRDGVAPHAGAWIEKWAPSCGTATESFALLLR
jgi:hypothetical protein